MGWNGQGQIGRKLKGEMLIPANKKYSKGIKTNTDLVQYPVHQNRGVSFAKTNQKPKR